MYTHNNAFGNSRLFPAISETTPALFADIENHDRVSRECHRNSFSNLKKAARIKIATNALVINSLRSLMLKACAS
jgi:hypothetical protein